MPQTPKPSPREKSQGVQPQPGDNPKKQNSTDVDDAQLDEVTDDRAFAADEQDESEITDENQRSVSRAEPDPKSKK